MSKYISSLTATRGVAALLVVIFHFGQSVWPLSVGERFFSQGNLAVGYFFVLSGFVMMWTYRESTFTYGGFLKRRVARIVPLYLFALVLAVIFHLYNYAINDVALESHFKTKILLNATFLQTYFPGNALSINSPAWSLSVEMFFYLLFPLLLVMAKRNKNGFVIFGVSFWVLSQVIHYIMVKYWLPQGLMAHPHDLVYYNPVFHLNQFVIGILGVFAYEYFQKTTIRPLVWLVAAITVGVLFIPRSVSLHNGLLAPLFMLLVVSVAISGSKILKSRPMVFLGDVSYGIYILQFPVYFYLDELNKKLLHINPSLFFYTYIIILILCSAISYRVIEQPLRNRINGIK